jgi:cation diffusion facilitator CzcD-associated flavoprotein CzcO/acetyl esterase/lipase
MAADTANTTRSDDTDEGSDPDVDVVVVGAGFSGLYMLHRLRGLGFSTIVLEGADDVGGTWYWNRYPGARCDIQSIDYSYSFDPELEAEWTWSEKYATQPEILRYADFVATKHDLRRDIRFSTRVERAVWDEEQSFWRIQTDTPEEITCRHYVMATGCLSVPKTPDIEGYGRFGDEVYFTGKWPHEKVDFTGKRVAVIGTGSSGIQSIPMIAEEAAALTVFQRTPNFATPAWNGPIPAEKLEAIRGREAEYREEAKWSRGGVPGPRSEVGAQQVTEEERQARFDEVWAAGELFASVGAFNDIMINPASNDLFTDYLRGKIRSIVDDPETAETLCPKNHYFGTKRPCLDTNYFATFNLPHVRLVDLREDPITTITETGIDTASESMEFDAIVFAIGFDAMTGPIVAVDITGRDGSRLADAWESGPVTYLGLTSVGFPNFFTITGPGSPSVLSNMMVSIEQHVDWIADCLDDMRANERTVIEPTTTAQKGWVQHVNDCADITLYPTANSWYMGSNVPGKPRVFLPYVGGLDGYRAACDEVADDDYLGFAFEGPDGTSCVDGVVRRVQPDVAMVLDIMDQLDLPPVDSMSPEDARAFMLITQAERPPGPDVGETVDGVLPGADGDLEYRLYRPATEGPHPIVAYFHGGGWVLGSLDSDDPFCRDLCVRSDAIVVSVNYRHAPEHRFPAAPEDAFAAVRWIADNAEVLGGVAGKLVVCGWSAGANLAAVVSQMAREAGSPAISGQVLVNPVVDSDFTRGSYDENADGFILTRSLMNWFWDHYADTADRENPQASPIRADSLADLPPALVVTCEFDPLRDEGRAYVEALDAAGTPARLLALRGHMHTSLPSVDMIISSAGPRAEVAGALRDFLGAHVPA